MSTTLDPDSDVEVGEFLRSNDEDGFVDFVSEEGAAMNQQVVKVESHSISRNGHIQS